MRLVVIQGIGCGIGHARDRSSAFSQLVKDSCWVLFSIKMKGRFGHDGRQFGECVLKFVSSTFGNAVHWYSLLPRFTPFRTGKFVTEWGMSTSRPERWYFHGVFDFFEYGGWVERIVVFANLCRWNRRSGCETSWRLDRGFPGWYFSRIQHLYSG